MDHPFNYIPQVVNVGGKNLTLRYFDAVVEQRLVGLFLDKDNPTKNPMDDWLEKWLKVDKETVFKTCYAHLSDVSLSQYPTYKEFKKICNEKALVPMIEVLNKIQEISKREAVVGDEDDIKKKTISRKIANLLFLVILGLATLGALSSYYLLNIYLL